ncbi:MAG TPA: SMC family ATPase [Pseudonocardiaceae bacterium]
MRLMLDGFGSYRERTELDLSDVGFFVLTGPTGAGKSTVIDAMCFALYGTVPRWGKSNVIKNALAPSTTEARVCLVFEAAGGRYAAARALRRDARDQVHTKEARLDRLDPAVPPDAELARILEACVEPIAEGPDRVAAEVTELLGIGYEHFTQCVLLPQGRFAEFLHAKPGERQNLLIELLAYAVYEQVGQRARERARVAGAREAGAQERLASLGEVTQDEVDAAQRRVAALDELVPRVDAAVAEIAGWHAEAPGLAAAADEARAHLTRLAALRMPGDVPRLAAMLADADRLVERRVTERTGLDGAEAAAERHCAGLTARPVLVAWRGGYTAEAALRADLAERVRRRDEADGAERALTARVDSAERATADAAEALAAAERAHSAAALATGLRPGQPCPVCRQPVAAVPHHDVPADLGLATAALNRAKEAQSRLRAELTTAGQRTAVARTAVEDLERRLADAAAALVGAPPLAEVDALLTARDRVEAEVERARSAARAGRSAAEDAVRARDELRAAEQRAWSQLRSARDWAHDGFVALHAPAVDGLDLAAAWRALLDWAAGRHAGLSARAGELDATAGALRERIDAGARTLAAMLGEHGVVVLARDVQRAPVALAAHLAEARRDLAQLRTRQAEAAALAGEIARHREERQVADKLGGLLRSDGFERWLCTEAIDSLVFEASETLLQLSSGQYELDRGERNELVVIDHNDAGTRRPVHTLSGGETFQASLALALALSHQVVGLSGGRRSLDSMFLDEGFGTLDDATLDTVASTLERLACDSDRLIGIVTHVPALAERVPVQFAVTRDGASSRLRRVPV